MGPHTTRKGEKPGSGGRVGGERVRGPPANPKSRKRQKSDISRDAPQSA